MTFHRNLAAILFIAVFAAIGPAAAQCTSPSGEESQTRYASNKLYYCGDGDWHEVPGASAGGVGVGCVVGSVYLPSGTSHTFFSTAIDNNCPSFSQLRNCTDGVLSGSASFQYPTCISNDSTPNAFSFNNVTGAAKNATITPSPASVTISGIAGSVPVSVTGTGTPLISVNGGSWVASGFITNGQTLAVQLTSGAASTTRTAAITVGDTTVNWSVTTVPPANCILGVAHGQTRRFYNSSNSSSCPSTNRTCNDGVLSGPANYSHSSCTRR